MGLATRKPGEISWMLPQGSLVVFSRQASRVTSFVQWSA